MPYTHYSVELVELLKDRAEKKSNKIGFSQNNNLQEYKIILNYLIDKLDSNTINNQVREYIYKEISVIHAKIILTEI